MKGSDEMQTKEPKLTWQEAPDVINPYNLADILGIGENKAREIFNSKDFPRIKCTGVKQIADKNAVRLWCMNMEATPEVVGEIFKVKESDHK